MRNPAQYKESAPAGGGRRRTAAEVLPFLHEDLSATLASLHGAPASIAQATIQLLPFGSRAALETLGLATPAHAVDADGHRTLTLTSLAYEVMAEVAAVDEADPAGVSYWAHRAELAEQALRKGPAASQ